MENSCNMQACTYNVFKTDIADEYQNSDSNNRQPPPTTCRLSIKSKVFHYLANNIQPYKTHSILIQKTQVWPKCKQLITGTIKSIH